MFMKRDVTGTCRETCFEMIGGKKTKIKNCYILLAVTYTNWCDEDSCTKTMFNSYWHS